MDTLRRLILIVTLFSARRAYGASQNCPLRCNCDTRHYDMEFDDIDIWNGVFVDCDNAGLTSVPNVIPEDTVSVNLDNNFIANLTFNWTQSMERIGKISLENNYISSLYTNTFHAFPNIWEIELNSNRMKNVEMRVFDGLNHLQSVDLSMNSISTVDFTGVDRLHINTLYLHENNIHEILVESGQQLAITELYLNHNNISHVDFLAHIETSKLELSGNRIQVEDLKYLDSLRTVRDLHLVNCSIDTINEDTLSNMVDLQTLDLSRNNIKAIATSVFRRNTKLSVLILSHNQLVSFGDDAFVSMNLPSLDYLDISYNKIETIAAEFISGVRLGEFDLSNNMIQVLPESISTFLAAIDTVIINDNPFHCNCEMRWFREYIERMYGPSNQFAFEHFLCSSPPQLRQSILELSPSRFSCAPPVITYISPSVAVDFGGDVFLSCASEGDPAPVIILDTPLEGEEYRVSPPKNRTKTRTNTAYKLSNLQKTAEGEYVCRASNLAGSTAATVSVRVITNNTTTAPTTTPSSTSTTTITTSTASTPSSKSTLLHSSSTTVQTTKLKQPTTEGMSKSAVFVKPTEQPHKSSKAIIISIVVIALFVGLLMLLMYFGVRFVQSKRRRGDYPPQKYRSSNKLRGNYKKVSLENGNSNNGSIA